MSAHEHEWSYVTQGANSWERTRHFEDGSDAVLEWQCSDCHKWYPMFSGIMGWSQSLTKGVWTQPLCNGCRPPETGLLKHLHDGGACIIGFTDNQNPWKRWADKHREKNGNVKPQEN